MIDPAAGLELPQLGAEAARSARHAQSYWSQSWEQLRENRIGVGAGLLIGLFTLIAITAPLVSRFITHATLGQQDLEHTFALPGTLHLLGTDELGRDTLTRLVYGAQVSLGIGFLTVFFSITLGTTVGLVSGYYGGIVDDLLMRLVDVILSIPAIFLLILMAILFKPNAVTLALIIASIAWGSVARLVRGEVLTLKNRDFMIATRSVGARDSRLVVRHLFPNVLHVLIVFASLNVGQIILIEAALDYLGLGITAPTPSWGNMLTNAQTYFFHSAFLVAFPGLTIFLTVLATNLFGNALRDAFDPKLKQ
jgi:peptide/nickel transport system permease protein